MHVCEGATRLHASLCTTSRSSTSSSIKGLHIVQGSQHLKSSAVCARSIAGAVPVLRDTSFLCLHVWMSAMLYTAAVNDQSSLPVSGSCPAGHASTPVGFTPVGLCVCWCCYPTSGFVPACSGGVYPTVPCGNSGSSHHCSSSCGRPPSSSSSSKQAPGGSPQDHLLLLLVVAVLGVVLLLLEMAPCWMSSSGRSWRTWCSGWHCSRERVLHDCQAACMMH